MDQLQREILENLKDSLTTLHGTHYCDPVYYHRLIAEGLNPEQAWRLFEKTTRKVDTWQELCDVDTLLKEMEF